MAQKSGSRSSGVSSVSKKGASANRGSGVSKNNTSGRGSGAAGSGRSVSQKKPVTTAKAAPEEPFTAKYGIHREVGAIVLLFFGVVALISWFPADGWLLSSYRTLMKGLFGYGYYLTPVALLWGMSMLWLRREQPVKAGLICALLLPAVFGMIVHIAAFDRDTVFVSGFGAGLKKLWELAQQADEHCGGAVSGTIGHFLRKSISRVGAILVTVLAFLLMTVRATNHTVLQVWEMIRERYELKTEGEEPASDAPAEEKHTSSRRRPAESPEAVQKPVPKKSTARRSYDEEWEEEKDRLFAAMEVDRHAGLRVAALQKERKDRKPEPEKKAQTEGKPEPEKKKPEPEKAAGKADTADVKPLSVEEAAEIAGVEIHSADMDDGAAGPVKKKKIDKDAEAAAVAEEISRAEEEKPEYIFPELSLLYKSDPKQLARAEATDENEARLESAIRSFGVGATITGAIHGPTVTRYELLLDQGVKLSKITNLQNDIALSIGVSSVRIAPIPNKRSTVGVEVPNREKTNVLLGDVIDSDAFRDSKSKLSAALGKDIGGNVIVGNIAKMPHVLIAGTTGSGKSVCINALILSLIYKATPDEVRMIMIDPKQVELGIYNGMPHLYVPVVTDPKKAAGALQWSVVEMLKRYRLFSEVGVRDLAGYNAVLRANDQPTLPQVVIIIDELADLMMVAAKEVEESICRVAQMGRAAGMHLVVATQSPRADVITGLMKANSPSRIAFAVSSALESRIILDQQGAEKLIGQGDMLYSPIGMGKPLRVQGAFVTDEEREEIINFVKREAEAEYSDEILAEIEKSAVKEDKKSGKNEPADDEPKNDYDELLPQAVEVIFETKQASVSMLQRRLKLGYSRAARLVDQLEEVGVVGPYEGSKPRQILLTKQQWQEMQYSQGTAPVDTIAREFAAVSENDAFAAPQEDELSGTDDIPWDEEEDEDEDV